MILAISGIAYIETCRIILSCARVRRTRGSVMKAKMMATVVKGLITVLLHVKEEPAFCRTSDCVSRLMLQDRLAIDGCCLIQDGVFQQPLGSQWAIDCQAILGYLRVSWPVVLGFLPSRLLSTPQQGIPTVDDKKSCMAPEDVLYYHQGFWYLKPCRIAINRATKPALCEDCKLDTPAISPPGGLWDAESFKG